MMDAARAVADAVLYEGFLLFPYAKSSLKNRMPFQFGVVMPLGYDDPTEPAFQHSEFLVSGGARVDGLLRFLQDGDEPIAREVAFSFAADAGDVHIPFAVDTLRGSVTLSCRRERDLTHVVLEVRNTTTVPPAVPRNQALRAALVSAHVLLNAHDGVFISLLDPPEYAKAAAAACRNERVFPVLAGEASGDPHCARLLLVSPIILYDFPRIAPASKAHTFDATEIDELLMLSVASLTDEEKREARAAHPYVRELIERAEALDADTQRAMHGELTGAPASAGDERVTIGGVEVARGSRVRVHPKGRADVWDDLVRGMTARVNAVHTDFEGKRYVGVVFDGDPASDLHEWYGRSFFYGADEVEPLP